MLVFKMFSALARLVQRIEYKSCTHSAMRCRKALRMPKMPSTYRRTVTTIIASVLLAASVNATEPADADSAGNEPAKSLASEINRDLARQANTVAVRDAIEAVLSANKLHLDIRINARTSAQTPEETTDGR